MGHLVQFDQQAEDGFHEVRVDVELLATLVSVLRDWAARILGLFGYKRYSDDDPLEHETRERLYECIRDSPGVYLSEITEETGLKMGTAR